MISESVVCLMAANVLRSNPWFSKYNLSPSRKAVNCSAMIFPKVGPIAAPSVWFSARPPVHKSNFIDSAVGLLQSGCCLGITRYLAKACVGRQTERLPRFVQGTQSQIATSLNVNCSQVCQVRRIGKKISQVINNMSIEGVGGIVGQVPKQAICPACRDEC